MVTIEASSTTISWATAMTARARKRLGFGPDGSDLTIWTVGSYVVDIRGVSVVWRVRTIGTTIDAGRTNRPSSGLFGTTW